MENNLFIINKIEGEIASNQSEFIESFKIAANKFFKENNMKAGKVEFFLKNYQVEDPLKKRTYFLC